MQTTFRFLAAVLLAALSCHVLAGAEPGQPAPDFSLRNLAGETVALSQFKGRTVVIEWNNPNCPFVRKHYASGNMQGLQQGRGNAVWLTINSTSPHSPDFMDATALQAWIAVQKAQPTAYLLDGDGAVGRTYGAKTTPHMFVVDAAGRVAYAGAIDDRRSANVEDVAGAANYVKAALDAVAQGRAVAVPGTAPYGCSVKY